MRTAGRPCAALLCAAATSVASARLRNQHGLKTVPTTFPYVYKTRAGLTGPTADDHWVGDGLRPFVARAAPIWRWPVVCSCKWFGAEVLQRVATEAAAKLHAADGSWRRATIGQAPVLLASTHRLGLCMGCDTPAAYDIGQQR